MDVKLSAIGKSKASGSHSLSDAIFNQRYNEALVHQVVTAYLAGARQGSKAQKNRSAVSGGGKKPWRQKGTGRARVGTIRSPIWRSGGVTFAATNRDFSQKVNRKMYRTAICSILSELLRTDRLMIVDKIELDTHKTKDFAALLNSADLRDVLIITEDFNDNLYLASRNLYHVGIYDVANVNPADLIAYDKVILTVDAAKKLEESLQ